MRAFGYVSSCQMQTDACDVLCLSTWESRINFAALQLEGATVFWEWMKSLSPQPWNVMLGSAFSVAGSPYGDVLCCKPTFFILKAYWEWHEIKNDWESLCAAAFWIAEGNFYKRHLGSHMYVSLWYLEAQQLIFSAKKWTGFGWENYKLNVLTKFRSWHKFQWMNILSAWITMVKDLSY